MGDRKGTKVYVGNLNPDANERDLRDMFERYGHLTDVWVARKPPGFGFVWYDDPRDADDCVRELDNRELLGKRLRVEISSSRGPGGRGGPGGSECYECGGRGHFARECPRRRGGGGGGYGRRRSPSPRRRYRSRSRSPYRSPPPRGRSRSRSRSPRSRSRSPVRRRSPSRSPPPRGSPPPRNASVSPPRRSPSPRRDD